MKKIISCLLFISCMISEARSEYRVYQYLVKQSQVKAQDLKPYLTTSTMDPVSYLAYHGGGNSIKIDLIRSWMCKGYTAKKEACSSPLESALIPSTPQPGALN